MEDLYVDEANAFVILVPNASDEDGRGVEWLVEGVDERGESRAGVLYRRGPSPAAFEYEVPSEGTVWKGMARDFYERIVWQDGREWRRMRSTPQQRAVLGARPVFTASYVLAVLVCVAYSRLASLVRRAFASTPRDE